jgi:FtsP/CotA-like multicopper oxidase with cupredoxin domain
VRGFPLLPVLLPGCVGDAWTAGTDDDSGIRAGDTGTPPAPEVCGYTPAEDLDPAEDVVEVDLAAAATRWDPGTGVEIAEGLAYNGQVPGPVIEVERGQVLRVNFTNGLDHDSTVHWHGLRVPDAMDGAIRMVEMVPPGASFTYEFEVVDTGFYWFHPHMATDLDLERGLYGTIISRHPDEPRVPCEMPIVLDDILLDNDGQVEPPDTEHGQLMGRLGNLLLTNGKADRRVEVRSGETTLLRLVNASNARTWDLSIEGHAMRLLATDGGWLPAPYALDSVRVSPGERVVVAVDFEGAQGDAFQLVNARFRLHDEHADMSEIDPMGDDPNPAMTFVVGPDAGTPTEMTLPADDAPDLADPGTTAHQWVLDEEMMDGIVTIDGFSYPDVPLLAVPGPALTAFEVKNDSEMHHPFHLHGNRFQVMGVDGISPPYAGWKDTFDVPPFSTVRIVSELDNPGEWMYHCHILEHAELGMAGFMTVGE